MSDPSLHEVYQRIASRVGAFEVVEPLESVEAVYRHRRFWQPDALRVVLLAESHVYTAAEELLNRVDLSTFGVHGAPPEYARFVYCLGYGEDELVQGKVTKNAGTRQFWRLFYSCVHPVNAQTGFSPVLKGGERGIRGALLHARAAGRQCNAARGARSGAGEGESLSAPAIRACLGARATRLHPPL